MHWLFSWCVWVEFPRPWHVTCICIWWPFFFRIARLVFSFSCFFFRVLGNVFAVYRRKYLYLCPFSCILFVGLFWDVFVFCICLVGEVSVNSPSLLMISSIFPFAP